MVMVLKDKRAQESTDVLELLLGVLEALREEVNGLILGDRVRLQARLLGRERQHARLLAQAVLHAIARCSFSITLSLSPTQHKHV